VNRPNFTGEPYAAPSNGRSPAQPVPRNMVFTASQSQSPHPESSAPSPEVRGTLSAVGNIDLVDRENAIKHGDHTLHANIFVLVGQSRYKRYTLVDNGSLCNIMRQDLFDTMKDKGEKLEIKDTLIQSINSLAGQISVKGEVAMDIFIEHQFGLHKFTTSFLLVDAMPYEILLGAEAMRDGHLLPDVERKMVLINPNIPCYGPSIPFAPHEETLAFSCSVACAETVYLPAKTMSYAEGLVDQRLSNKVGQMEGCSLHDNPLFCGVDAVVKVQDGKLPLLLVNFSEEPVTIKKGSQIGCLMPWKPATNNFSTTGRNNEPNSETEQKIEAQLAQILDSKETILDNNQKYELTKLLKKQADLFIEVSKQIGRTGLVKHRIDTGTSSPTVQGMRRIPEAQKRIIDEEVDKMLKHKVIRPSSSPYRANFVLVQKKDGSWRPCLDFRLLNSVTKKDQYPLPRIDETLDSMGRAKFFSTIDLAHGYWQVELEEGSKEKTAFASRRGLFEFETMPFGLCNAPSTFQRLMDVVLGGDRWDFCMVYLDDIIIYSSTFDDHVAHLKKIFDKLRIAGMKMKAVKCRFGLKEVPFLGHVVSAEGIRPNPDKIQAITDWPVPENKQHLASFLGFIQYYRRFIYNFAEKASPLMDMKRGKVEYQWNEKCQDAFDALKREATSYPTLRYPDFQKPFIVCTDACQSGIGAVLAQQEDGKEWAVAYASRILSETERRYHINEKEMLAVFWAVTHVFRPYVFGQQFDLVSDSSAVRALKSYQGNNGRILRWQQELCAYTFVLYHRKGLANSNADGLSRRSAESQLFSSEERPTEAPVNFTEFGSNLLLHSNTGSTKGYVAIPRTIVSKTNVATVVQNLEEKIADFEKTWPVNWSLDQWDDVFCKDICRYLILEQLPLEQDKANQVIKESPHFRVGEDRQLYRFRKCGSTENWQLVVPQKHQKLMLEYFHNSLFGCHMGMVKTLHRIQDKYWWPHMWLDVQQWVNGCVTCQMVKKGNPSKAPLQNISVGQLFELIGIDILQLPKTENGNKYVIVCTEYMSRWVIAQATSDTKAETVAKFLLERVVLQHGAPKAILSDQGKQFTADLVMNLCKILEVKKLTTVPYHPQSDGLTERFNRTLISMLASSVNDQNDEWDILLPFIVFAYNTAIQSSSGQVPFEMIYGRRPMLPIDNVLRQSANLEKNDSYGMMATKRRMQLVQKLATECSANAKRKQKHYYDQKSKNIQFDEHQPVWLINSRRPKGVDGKLEPHWIGPYVIVRQVSPVNYVIRPMSIQAPERTVHCNQLRLYYSSPEMNSEAENFDKEAVENSTEDGHIQGVEAKSGGTSARQATSAEDVQLGGSSARRPTSTGEEVYLGGAPARRYSTPAVPLQDVNKTQSWQKRPTMSDADCYRHRRRFLPGGYRVGDAISVGNDAGYILCPNETQKRKPQCPSDVLAIKFFGGKSIRLIKQHHLRPVNQSQLPPFPRTRFGERARLELQDYLSRQAELDADFL